MITGSLTGALHGSGAAGSVRTNPAGHAVSKSFDEGRPCARLARLTQRNRQTPKPCANQPLRETSVQSQDPVRCSCLSPRQKIRQMQCYCPALASVTRPRQ